MNCKTESICRLCLNSTDSHFDVIDDITKNILDTLSVKIDFSTSPGSPVMCSQCADTLQKCFDLVCLCQKTRESKSFSLRFNEEQRNVVNDGEYKSCLFCMGTVRQAVCSSLRQLEEDIVSLQGSLSKCIFELYAIATVEPVLCEFCHESLQNYMSFARNCLGVERINAMDVCKVKKEDSYEPGIKRERFIETSDIALHTDVKLDDYESKSLNNRRDSSAPKDTFQCESCSFVTTTKRYLKKHSVRHASDTPLFKCDLCPFTTRHKWYLSTHALMHNDAPDYLCPMCTYRTKNPKNFKRHLANHDKSPSYKCDRCSFATKHRICLRRHSITHKEPSDIVMYKCDECQYETRFKKNLATHSLVHKDASEVTMYHCDDCSYKTKTKHNLVIHKLIHKSESEVEIFKCQVCSYTTKRKKNLSQHSVVHKGVAEVETFQCGLCGYVAKRKTNLAQHMAGVHRSGR